VTGLVIGYRATMRRSIVPAERAVPDTGFAGLLAAQYHVDAIYDRLIVRPVVWFSRTILWKTIDQWIIDFAGVMGSARILQGLGWFGSRLQTGQLGLYLLLFVAGAVWALGYMLR